jgi:hypothetical protein
MSISQPGLRRLLLGGLGVAALAACGNQGRSPSVGDGERNVSQTTTDHAAIRQLFEEAAACGDRYRCPPQDELLARAEGPEGTPVAEVALELMADPGVRSFDRLGKAAFEVARNWAAARVRAGTFDAGARSMLLGGVRRVLADDSSTFVVAVYSLFSGPIGDAIPEAKEILTAEALNPKRDLSQMDDAVKVLQRFTPGLGQIRPWLESGDERRQLAALSLLDYADHTGFSAAEEQALLEAAARRPNLPQSVAIALVGHVQGHEDEAFLPVLVPLERHGDAELREAATEAAAAIRQAEAARGP